MNEDLANEEMERPPSRVLVVIGESASRAFVVRILESVLLEVDSASRYEEALEKLLNRHYRPAALIIDPTIPRVDGVELIRKIHAERPDLLNRTIVIAEQASPLSERIRRESPCRQIQRPVLRHELIEAVSECLREPQS